MSSNQVKNIFITPLYFGGDKIERIGKDCTTKAFKFLGHWVDDQLNWDIHTSKLINKLNCSNYAMAKVKNKLPNHVKKAIYYSLSHSILNCGSLITGATSISNINRLESVQNKIVRNLCNANYNAHSLPLYFSNNI